MPANEKRIGITTKKDISDIKKGLNKIVKLIKSLTGHLIDIDIDSADVDKLKKDMDDISKAKIVFIHYINSYIINSHNLCKL